MSSSCPPRSLVARITAILSTFRAGSCHSVTEIARLTGLPVSTTHRLAAELASWQFLHREADGRYRVGPALRNLDDHPGTVPTLQEQAPQVLTDLGEATGRRARLGVLDNGRVAYVEKPAGGEPVTAFSLGSTLPAHATALGKALLAFAPPGTFAALARRLTVYTPQTLDSPERLRRALRAIRLTRLAISRGELVAGDVAVAVPVFAPGGAVVAALEVEVTDSQVDFRVCQAALTVAAGALARDLAVPVDPARPHLRVVENTREALPAVLEPLRHTSGG